MAAVLNRVIILRTAGPRSRAFSARTVRYRTPKICILWFAIIPSKCNELIVDKVEANICINARIPSLRYPVHPTWKTFLHNHIGQMVSIDFFTVPTISMRVLFVFVVLEHRRRQVLHFAVTEHPTAAWTAQQIIEAFADRDAARFLARDRNSIYGVEVRAQIAALGMAEVLTAPQSPWQNPYAERLIGSIRRECLNHFVILSARHLRKTWRSTSIIIIGPRPT